ncbi:MAG: DUF2155 domain-containing protein [Pseudomonadota bacterium]
MMTKIKVSFFFFLSLCFFMSVALAANAQEAIMDDKQIVKLQALDKSTARTETFQAKVGSTIQYASLYIKIQACRKSKPLEKPENAAFLQVWEVPPGKKKSEWIFSGWMFASSPALSAMDHPVYDVWVLDCLDEKQEESVEEAEKSNENEQNANNQAVQSEVSLGDDSDEEPQESQDSGALDEILDTISEN